MATELVPFRIEPEWKERLENLAEIKGFSRSQAVRTAVIYWLKANYKEKEEIMETNDGQFVKINYRMTPDRRVDFVSAEIIV